MPGAPGAGRRAQGPTSHHRRCFRSEPQSRVYGLGFIGLRLEDLGIEVKDPVYKIEALMSGIGVESGLECTKSTTRTYKECNIIK